MQVRVSPAYLRECLPPPVFTCLLVLVFLSVWSFIGVMLQDLQNRLVPLFHDDSLVRAKPLGYLNVCLFVYITKLKTNKLFCSESCFQEIELFVFIVFSVWLLAETVILFCNLCCFN